MGLKQAERLWLSQTNDEEFYLDRFPKPKVLRRPISQIRALASLSFGRYKDLSDQIVEDDRVVWLDFIVSEEQGKGRLLLDKIKRLMDDHSLALCGEPIPLKPQDWTEGRVWMRKPDELISWYIRQDFKVVQTALNTRVWYLPHDLNLVVDVKLSPKGIKSTTRARAS